MKKEHSRREFIQKGSRLSLGCGALMMCPHLNSFGRILRDVVPDPKKLNYCGYTCPADCRMYIATIENDTAKKQEAYELWGLQKKYGIDFDSDQVICYKCKNNEKPHGIVLEKCTVRSCAIDKGYDCCIECDDLETCDKELWKTFPDFHNSVIEMQKKYKDATAVS